jgi:hypothetical protein
MTRAALARGMRAFVVLLLLAPLAAPAASALGDGCTYVGGAYYCAAEESSNEDCADGESGYAFTFVGVGASGVAGAQAGGYEGCGPYSSRYLYAGGGAVLAYPSVMWAEGSQGSCSVIVHVNGPPTWLACPAGATPPDLGWGHLLS